MQAADPSQRVHPAADAPPDVESHQFLDWFGLELARAVAARLLADPSLLEIARANLRRWLAGDAHAPGVRRAFLEWRDLLAADSLEETLRVLTDPSEEGDRRRQSWPFVGVLTRDESQAIYAACEAAARTAHEKTATAALAR